MRIFWWTVIFCWAGLLTAQEPGTSYWEQNSAALDMEDDSLFTSFGALDTVVAEYEFFFTAEQHWKSINSQIQFSFLKYLYEKAGVRNLILEGGYSYGFLINRYLETGDKRLLRKVVNDLPVCPDNQMEMFRKVFQFNKGKAPADKIRVSGIDLEHSPELVLQCILAIRPEATPPARLAGMMDRLMELHESPYFDEREVRRYFRKLDKDISRKKSQYASYWGKDFDLLEMIVANTLEGFNFSLIKATIFPKSWQKREERMYKNFLVLQPYFQEGKFYAQFGALHTDIKQSVLWEFPSLAHRLNYFSSSPVENRVLTISRYFERMNDNYARLGESDDFLEMIGSIREAFQENVVLLSMIGQGSPFTEMSQTFQFILYIDPELEEQGCE